jgi:hypothetical protein
MAPVWLTLRADMRRTWLAMLGLALLLGLIGGVVLAAADGAWRTDTAYPRLLGWANASQLEVIPTVSYVVPEDFYRALGRLLGWVLLVIPATIALTNLNAAWPGRRAARLRPAAVLRAE